MSKSFNPLHACPTLTVSSMPSRPSHPTILRGDNCNRAFQLL
jgi:hypothetical protein